MTTVRLVLTGRGMDADTHPPIDVALPRAPVVGEMVTVGEIGADSTETVTRFRVRDVKFRVAKTGRTYMSAPPIIVVECVDNYDGMTSPEELAAEHNR